MAECICQTAICQAVHSIDFFLHITGCFVVILFRPCQIYRLMSNIQISANNQWFDPLEVFQITEKSLVPVLPE